MKRGAIIGFVAVAGCALLAYIMPRAHPAATWDVRFGRQESIVKAREISAALGVDTSSWQVTASGSSDEKRGYFAARHPEEDAARRFTPVYPKVTFALPGKADRIVVQLSAAGDVNAWERKGAPKAKTSAPPGDAAQSRGIAENALQRLAGPTAGSFRLVTEAAPQHGNLLFAWERAGLVTERFEATVDGGSLVKAELKPVYNRGVDEAYESQKRYVDRVDVVTAVLVNIAGTVFAAGIYIYWAVRRAVKYRFVFTLTAVAMAFRIVSWFNWGRFDESSNVTIGDTPATAWFGALLVLLFLTLFYLVLCGAMDAVCPGAKLATLRSVFTTSLFNRRTGISVLAGLLCGPLLTALPLWISSWHLLGSQQTGDYSAELIYSIHPGLESIDFPISPAILGILGIGVGFLARLIRKPALAFAALFVLGTLLWGSLATPSETSPVSYLIKGALLFLIYRELFSRFDILAALSAAWSARVIWSAGAQLLQPDRSLHVSGITALSLLASLTVFAAVLAWRGRELAAADSPAENVVATSQRDSLMAEFSIAHRVQQQMLPVNPPDIPGCTIAASCNPAREVGGDLFDFLKLPDGRWTIGIGDVSGKGVPAALYMTLTKGLLAATTADSSDLLDIMANVNHHIRAVTERNTFVTFALGALDAETRSFDHIRAGHNPIVWRQPSRNATSLLNSPGIGLGMVSDRLFRRATALDRVQLSSGDLLVFYSDGLTEAMNSDQEQFGEERLMRAAEEADRLDASAVRELILSKVKTFLNGIPAQDDMTLVVLRVS